MTTQLALDLDAGRALRDEGIERVEARGAEWLAEARRVAIWHIGVFGSVTADDVRERLPLPVDLHPNTWGSLFLDRRFVPVGDAQARHPEGHARRVRVWALRG